MDLGKLIKIKHKGKEYFINCKKTMMALSHLKDEPVNCKTEKELRALMREYRLYDEIFLERINFV